MRLIIPIQSRTRSDTFLNRSPGSSMIYPGSAQSLSRYDPNPRPVKFTTGALNRLVFLSGGGGVVLMQNFRSLLRNFQLVKVIEQLLLEREYSPGVPGYDTSQRENLYSSLQVPLSRGTWNCNNNRSLQSKTPIVQLRRP